MIRPLDQTSAVDFQDTTLPNLIIGQTTAVLAAYTPIAILQCNVRKTQQIMSAVTAGFLSWVFFPARSVSTATDNHGPMGGRLGSIDKGSIP
jgi:hypothetical protein